MTSLKARYVAGPLGDLVGRQISPEAQVVCARPKMWALSKWTRYGYQVVARFATFTEAQAATLPMVRLGWRCSISHVQDGLDVAGYEILINRFRAMLPGASPDEVPGLQTKINREIMAACLWAAQHGFSASLTKFGNVCLFNLERVGPVTLPEVG